MMFCLISSATSLTPVISAMTWNRWSMFGNASIVAREITEKSIALSKSSTYSATLLEAQ